MKNNPHKLVAHKRGELRLAAPLQKGRPAFIAAASGLVRHGSYFSVVGDDELFLGTFAADDLRAEKPLRLLPGKLPISAEKRKQAKPDFEVLTSLPPAAEYPHGAFLVMGSGSRPNRDRGLLLPLSDQAKPHADRSLLIDFSGLYADLRREFGVVNIEGAVVQGKYLLLMQRGNKGDGANAIVQLEMNLLLPELWRGAISARSLHAIRRYDMGDINGVPLGFSDATCLPDGRLLALAVAEDTSDAYLDGASFGSCLCQFDAHNELVQVTQLDIDAKAEGIAVWSVAEKTLAFVTDADDPEIPAALFISQRDARLDF